MNQRNNRNYSDCLYFVQALANCVYPYEPPAETWRRAIFDQAAIPYTDQPTISQLWLLEAFLIENIDAIHRQTEQLMMVKKVPLTQEESDQLVELEKKL